MTANPSLSGVEAKLARARKHLETLYDEINAFTGREPHEVVKEVDLEERTLRAIMKVHEEPDEIGWGVLIGDFTHNLRSALDHLVWQLVLVNGENPGRDNQFPIVNRGTRYWCSRKDGARSVRDASLRGVAEEHRAVIDAAQPYRAGPLADQHPLAILADLSNTDKHRLLHPTFIAIEEPSPSAFTVSSGDAGAIAHITFNSGPLKDGAEIMRTTFTTSDPNAKVHMNAEIPIGIAFGERRPVRSEVLGDPVLLTVEGIIERFRPAFPNA